MDFFESAVPREPHRGLRREDEDPFFPHILENSDSTGATTPVAQEPGFSGSTGIGSSGDMTGALKKVDSQETIIHGHDSQSSKHDVGWTRIVRNFTPSWFAVNMGTGIVSILLNQLPYNAQWLQDVSVGFFLLNIALFTTFTSITVLRYVMYPEIWPAMISHPAQSLFLGCFPMGFATIVNMTVFSCSDWGTEWVYFAWGMWWFDVVLSLACCISIPFVVMRQHKPALHATTAALLLPIVPAVVASASGAVIAEVLPNRSHAILTIVMSYILFGIGEAFALLVLSMYFHRLHVHSLPPREVIVSVFLPVGPLGQGGFAIQKLGTVLLDLLPSTETFSGAPKAQIHLGEMAYAIGMFCGILMWGFGLVWLAFALITIGTMKRFPFNMGWWGFTFPLGVFTTCTGMLAKELDSLFFKILTTIFSVSVLLLWVLVSVRTMTLVLTGEIFQAPCLQNVAKHVSKRNKNTTEKADQVHEKRDKSNDSAV